MPLPLRAAMLPSTSAAIAAVGRCGSRALRGRIPRVALGVLLCSVIGCGRYRFESSEDGSVSSQRPTITSAEDAVFWDNGGGDGETVTVEGTNYIDGSSTVYLSADDTLDAGDVAQQTTFIRRTQLTFWVDRGDLAQGDLFLFVTNDPGPTVFAADLTSDAYPVAVGRQWNPGDAQGVAGWWDASDPSTLLEAEGDQAESGDVIFRFMDKSGNANHFNSLGGARPALGMATIGTLGRQALAFSGGQRLGANDAPSLHLDGTGGVNIFSTVRSLGYMDHNSGLNVVLGKGLSASGNTAYALSMRSTQPLLFQSGANSLVDCGAVLDRDIVVAGVSQSAGPSTYVQVDGRLVNEAAAKGPSDNTAPLILADDTASNNRYAAVVIGELLLVGGALSAEDVARFEGYLAHRWGIPLDPAHPYAEKFTVVVIDAP